MTKILKTYEELKANIGRKVNIKFIRLDNSIFLATYVVLDFNLEGEIIAINNIIKYKNYMLTKNKQIDLESIESIELIEDNKEEHSPSSDECLISELIAIQKLNNVYKYIGTIKNMKSSFCMRDYTRVKEFLKD